MNCNDEVTSVDAQARQAGQSAHVSGSGGGESGDELNLYPYINRDQVHGLNLAAPAEEAAKAPIKPWDQRQDQDKYAESGVDDTFILNVPFTTAVRIKSVLINVGVGDFAPARIRAYVNRPDGVSFDDLAGSAATAPEQPATGAGPSVSAEPALGGIQTAPLTRAPPSSVGNVGSGKPQADFNLLEDARGVVEYPVPIARFANTNSVSIVFSDSQAGDVSRVYYLGFRGTALQLKQEPGSKLDIGAANAADAPVNKVREQYGAAQNTNVR